MMRLRWIDQLKEATGKGATIETALRSQYSDLVRLYKQKPQELSEILRAYQEFADSLVTAAKNVQNHTNLIESICQE